MNAGKSIRVLIVDDSALVRRVLTEALQGHAGIEVVGTANDAYMAREKIKELSPDLITLDVEMPRMDGVTFLRNLMRLRPMPVIMVSTLTEHGADVTLDALEAGAIDYMPKPKIDIAATLANYGADLAEKILGAASARFRAPQVRSMARASITARQVTPCHDTDAVLARLPPPRHLRTTDRIIAIGASTGGTEAIREVLMALPPDAPGIVIAQHIPKAFSGAFARRMNGCTALTVCEAQDGQQVLPGHAYIAPGDQHLVLARDGARYVCKLDNGLPVNRHKPSVDVLFRSVAQAAGHNAIGAILTGMGKDGAQGLREMRDAGSQTVAQDEETSIVWGMPGEAVAQGGATHVLPLGEIAGKLLQIAEELDVTRQRQAR